MDEPSSLNLDEYDDEAIRSIASRLGRPISPRPARYRKAVYAGSFDPITNGHVWMIEHGSRMFDELVVAIGVNPDKRYTFPLAERMQMLKETIVSSNVSFDTFCNKFLVRYSSEVGAQYILRGIRNSADYEYEKAMRHVNSDLNDKLVTIFLMPPRDLTEISSSLVKGMVGPEGWEEIVAPFVPPPVAVGLKSLYTRATAAKEAKRRQKGDKGETSAENVKPA